MKTEDKKTLNISNLVLEKIDSGKIKMRPRWKFLADKIGLEFSLVCVLLSGVFVSSLIMYYWQINELEYYFGFGYAGIKHVLSSLPYELFITVVLLIVFLNFLIKKMEWGYKRSWSVWTGVLLGVMVLSSGGLLAVRAHEQFEQSSIVNDNPVIDNFFHQRLRNISNNAVYGKISAVKNDEVDVIENKIDKNLKNQNVQSSSTEVYTIKPEKLKINSQQKKFEVGEEIKIMGKRDRDGKFNAWGVKVIKQKKDEKAKDMKESRDDNKNKK